MGKTQSVFPASIDTNAIDDAKLFTLDVLEDAIYELEKKVGVDNSTDTDSIDYILRVHSTRHASGGDDEINVGGLSGELADDQPVKTSDAVSKLFCRIKTGTYTGDGSASQAITGVGFQPIFVRIWRYETADSGSYRIHERADSMAAGMAVQVYINDTNTRDNRITAFGSDGFTVDDDGTDSDPNKNGQAYCYLALG